MEYMMTRMMSTALSVAETARWSRSHLYWFKGVIELNEYVAYGFDKIIPTRVWLKLCNSPNNVDDVKDNCFDFG